MFNYLRIYQIVFQSGQHHTFSSAVSEDFKFSIFFFFFKSLFHSHFLNRFYLFILNRGEGKKRGRETSMCGCFCFSHAPPPQPHWGPDRARNPGMCPDWESNRRPFGSPAGAQSTEPHQPGLSFSFEGKRGRGEREREKERETDRQTLI